MGLSDAAIRNPRPIEGKTVKLSGGGGLQLWVTPNGGRYWRLAYRFNCKQLLLALGASIRR